MKYKIDDYVFVKLDDNYGERLFKIIKYTKEIYRDINNDIHEKYVCVNNTNTISISEYNILGCYDDWLKYKIDSIKEEYRSEYIECCELLKYQIELRTNSFWFNMFKECI